MKNIGVYRCVTDKEFKITKGMLYELKRDDRFYYYTDDYGFKRMISDISGVFEYIEDDPEYIKGKSILDEYRQKITECFQKDSKSSDTGNAVIEKEYRRQEIEKDLRICRLEERVDNLEQQLKSTAKTLNINME